MKFIIAVIIFSAIVLFHELGHFLLAKKNGIRVNEFSLGMGPTLLSTQRGETKYSLKLLPLGGSCAMAGEDMEDQSPGTFNAASVWGRIATVAAGPIFNFILAFVFSFIIVAMIGFWPSTVTAVAEGSDLEAAGLQPGDRITEFEGYNIDLGNDLNTYLALNELENRPLHLKYERDGKEYEITYNPETVDTYLMGFNRIDTQSLKVASVMEDMPMAEVGLEAGDTIIAINGVPLPDGAAYDKYIKEHPLTDQPIEVTYEHKGKNYDVTVTPKAYTQVYTGFNFNSGYTKTQGWETFKIAALEVKYWIRTTVVSLGKLLTGQFGVKDLSGPVGVVDVIGDTYEAAKEDGTLWVWVNMLNMAVLLSANLGVMNLLPIPALDGGRLIFLFVEAIRKRPMNRQVEGMVHFAGFVLLMMLMVVVMFNDIMRLF